MADAPEHAMAAALPAPAPTAPTEGAGDAATPSPEALAPKIDPTIIQSTPIGPNLSLQSLQDGTYRMAQNTPCKPSWHCCSSTLINAPDPSTAP